MKKIITISRQFGSGGRSIGKAVAEKLGYAYYDSELVQQVAEKTGLHPSYIEDAGEYAPGKSILSYAFSSGASAGSLSASDYLWSGQCSVIMELAEKGNCVIVGRCADYILRDREDCLNVFIYADSKTRIERAQERYGLSEKEAAKSIQQTDKYRASYYNMNSNKKWGMKESYHIMLDSGMLGIDGVVDILEKIYKEKTE